MSIAHIPGDDRLTCFPIGRPSIWALYKDAQRCFWSPDEIDFSKDRDNYASHPLMTDGMRRAVDYIMAFFASLDKLVNVNICDRFKRDFNIYEIDCFYDFQVSMENIHGETYSLQLDTLIADQPRRQHLIQSVATIPVVARMAAWINACTLSDESVAARLLRMVCTEGLFFMGAFCIIYWMQDLGLMKGLGQANELIARDETLHTRFAIHLYELLEKKLDIDAVHAIFKEAIAISIEFVQDAIPVQLPEMNSSLMTTYLECQVDNLLILLQVPILYGSKNPFSFMDKLNLQNKSNFFERRISEYSKPKVGDAVEFECVDEF